MASRDRRARADRTGRSKHDSKDRTAGEKELGKGRPEQGSRERKAGPGRLGQKSQDRRAS
jgi:hypothetical protein